MNLDELKAQYKEVKERERIATHVAQLTAEEERILANVQVAIDDAVKNGRPSVNLYIPERITSHLREQGFRVIVAQKKSPKDAHYTSWISGWAE